MVNKLKFIELLMKYQELFNTSTFTERQGGCGVVRMSDEYHNIYLPKKVPIGAPVPSDEND